MLELEQFLKYQLIKLPKNHPDRDELEAHFKLVHIVNSRRPKAETTEAPVEIKRFSDQAREVLTKEGHVIYPLTGQSIKDQINAGREFWHVTDVESVRSLSSRTTEVAFNPAPGKFFIPESNNRTLDEQLKMVAKYSQELQKRLNPELEAIIGQAPDYTSLIFLHLDATGEILFGEDYGYNYARTQTPTVGSGVADVGRFYAAGGPGVLGRDRGHGNDNVFAVPLVVPK